MSTEEVLVGKRVIRQAYQNQRSSIRLKKQFDTTLKSLNTEATKASSHIYDEVLDRLELDEVRTVVFSTENLAKIEYLMLRLEGLQGSYREQFGQLMRSQRQEHMSSLADGERRVGRILQKIGIYENRWSMSDESFKLVNSVTDKGFMEINGLLEKWKAYVFATFMEGVQKSLKLPEFKSLFFNDDGSLKTGSSLVQDSEAVVSRNVVAQRTAFQRQKAKEAEMDHCWNVNPLDERTKAICVAASLAGVIPATQMATDHGYPPRFICRCELSFVRPEWVDVNKGINSALADRRLRLMEDYVAAPRQKGSWMRMGTRVVPTDTVQASGRKMYKEIKTKLHLVRRTEVPEFVFEET